MNKMIRLVFCICILSFIYGCSTAILTPEGIKVRRAHTLTDVKGCELLGSIIAKFSTGMFISQRLLAGAHGTPPLDTPNLAYDYLIDARNKAANLNGTHIIPTNEPLAGQQRFDVYKCVN